MVNPPGCGVTSRSRKRGSLAGASESRSGGERQGAPRATPRPLVGEPHPEETLEAPELRSLRAAKHDELLPQRQIFEREVGAGSKRRTQRAQQRVRGTLPPWLARRWVITKETSALQEHAPATASTAHAFAPRVVSHWPRGFQTQARGNPRCSVPIACQRWNVFSASVSMMW